MTRIIEKAPGLIPLKAGMPTENMVVIKKPGIMFFIPVKYKFGKKVDVIVLSVELLYGKRFLADESFAKEYAKDRLQRITGKISRRSGVSNGNASMENKYRIIFRWIPCVYHRKCTRRKMFGCAVDYAIFFRGILEVLFKENRTLCGKK